MIYCQLSARAKLEIQDELHLRQVAQVLSDKPVSLEMPLSCPKKQGVWKIEALAVAAALKKVSPGEDVTMLGPDVCYVHRVHTNHHDWSKPLRVAAAFAILLFGSALGLAWFHSDVDMPKAQLMVFELLTGKQPTDPRYVTIPYVVGVALGVCVFYALPRRKAVTPLEVKLTEYQEDMESTEGRDVHGNE